MESGACTVSHKAPLDTPFVVRPTVVLRLRVTDCVNSLPSTERIGRPFFHTQSSVFALISCQRQQRIASVSRGLVHASCVPALPHASAIGSQLPARPICTLRILSAQHTLAPVRKLGELSCAGVRWAAGGKLMTTASMPHRYHAGCSPCIPSRSCACPHA